MEHLLVARNDFPYFLKVNEIDAVKIQLRCFESMCASILHVTQSTILQLNSVAEKTRELLFAKRIIWRGYKDYSPTCVFSRDFCHEKSSMSLLFFSSV